MYRTVQARTPPKSPSARSGSSSCSSSRDSSPILLQLSAATSSSDIDLVCGTPDPGRQGILAMVMEQHNRSFGLPIPLHNKTPSIEPSIEPASATSNPETSGFHNNVLAGSSSSSTNPRNILLPGNPTAAALFSSRSLTSFNWRNANLATSTNDRDAFFSSSYGSNEPALSRASNHHYYPSYNLNRSPSGVTVAMSSPASSQPNGSPATTGSGPRANNGHRNDVAGGGNEANVLSVTQVSQALAEVTQRQQAAGQGHKQTDMPVFAYCFDRGNGQYTRLIPADMLPPLADIPARQQGCLGMTVLPCPTGLAPNGRSSNLERVFLQPAQQFPGGQMRAGQLRDPVQSRIDTIIASAPPTETQKRQKIYCDKWIHEGVCAFTQQGCKYKHEMPLDKDTQESLGLFQGLPIWWRKHQGEITSDQQTLTLDSPPAVPAATRPRGISNTSRGGFGGANRLRQNTWRSQGRGPSGSVSSGSGSAGAVGGGGGGHVAAGQGRQQQQQVAQFSSPFGPIAPPSASTKREFEATPNTTQASRNPFVDNNPWAPLKADPDSSDSEKGAKLG